jgi:hypothetical protein
MGYIIVVDLDWDIAVAVVVTVVYFLSKVLFLDYLVYTVEAIVLSKDLIYYFLIALLDLTFSWS